MAYVDGFLLPCPTGAKDTYIRIATIAADVFRKNGANEVVEAWADDVPEGKLTSFPLAVKRAEDEAVVFSWVGWPDKATRDAGMKAFMDDASVKATFDEMPVDGKRMIFGSFSTLLDLPGSPAGGGYIDGLVAAVPDASRDAYIAHANTVCGIIMEHGALRCVENWGAEVPDGTVTSFPMAVKKADGESVVFSYIVWADKAARDDCWSKIMDDPRMKPDALKMPFDGQRMIFGGFVPIVHVF